MDNLLRMSVNKRCKRHNLICYFGYEDIIKILYPTLKTIYPYIYIMSLQNIFRDISPLISKSSEILNWNFVYNSK